MRGSPEQSPRVSFFIAMLIKPFALLAVAAAVYPARVACEKHMKEGRLKRILLFRCSDTPTERKRRREAAEAASRLQGGGPT